MSIQTSPAWDKRVQELEDEGLTRSDAQAVTDVEFSKKKGDNMTTKISKALQTDIKTWIKDFEKTQPSNVCLDDDTFEGGAYNLLQRVLREGRE